MSEREFKDVLARLVRDSKPRRDTTAVEHALTILRPNMLNLLAGLEGQSLAELQESFQLLPLGTRIALEQAGAIVQHDTGESQFHVEAQPLALDVVAAAVTWQHEAELAQSTPLLEAEVVRIWNERFVLDTQQAPAVANPELKNVVDPLGIFHAIGRVRDVAHEAQDGAVEVLWADKSDTFAKVRYASTLTAIPLKLGQEVRLEFAVGIPKLKGMISRRSRPSVTEGKIRDVVTRNPGYLFVRCSSTPDHGPSLISIPTGESEANAVAELRSVSEVP